MHKSFYSLKRVNPYPQSILIHSHEPFLNVLIIHENGKRVKSLAGYSGLQRGLHVAFWHHNQAFLPQVWGCFGRNIGKIFHGGQGGER